MEIIARAVGRRKEAVAQVLMKKGTGLVIINNKPANDYLQNDSCAILAVQAPFEVFKKNGVYCSTGALVPQATRNTVSADSTTTNHNGAENAATKANSTILTEIDTIIKVKGGGLKGQADAIRLGIARVLCLLDTASAQTADLQKSTVGATNTQASDNQTMVVGLKKQLKDKGYLTQDSRVKERRKYGLKKARKASQYHKR
jgi:small subunit ribosomal protein S9